MAVARRRFSRSAPLHRLLRAVGSALALASPTDERLRSIYEAALPTPSLSDGRVITRQPRLPAPGAFEQRFARLQREGRYTDMWPLLADDAQHVWGGPAAFARRMRDQAVGVELIDADVEEVDVLPEWTDARRGRRYHNVARLAVRYRVKHGQREWALRRRVHLVPAVDGWRTLWYPQPD